MSGVNISKHFVLFCFVISLKGARRNAPLPTSVKYMPCVFHMCECVRSTVRAPPRKYRSLFKARNVLYRYNDDVAPSAMLSRRVLLSYRRVAPRTTAAQHPSRQRLRSAMHKRCDRDWRGRCRREGEGGAAFDGDGNGKKKSTKINGNHVASRPALFHNNGERRAIHYRQAVTSKQPGVLSTTTVTPQFPYHSSSVIQRAASLPGSCLALSGPTSFNRNK